MKCGKKSVKGHRDRVLRGRHFRQILLQILTGWAHLKRADCRRTARNHLMPCSPPISVRFTRCCMRTPHVRKAPVALLRKGDQSPPVIKARVTAKLHTVLSRHGTSSTSSCARSCGIQSSVVLLCMVVHYKSKKKDLV